MSRLSRITTALNIESGEERVIVRLSAVAFCIGASIIIYFNVGSALFLTAFDVSLFPFVFLATAAISIVGNRLLSSVSGRYSARTFAIIVFGSAASLTLSLYLAIRLTDIPAFTFAVPILHGFVEIIVLVAFWGIAGRLFTVRQSKRLYGVIATGKVVASIIAGLLMALIIPLIGTLNLLLIVAALLIIALWLIVPLASTIEFSPRQLEVNNINSESKSGNSYVVAIVILFAMALTTNFLLNYLMFSETSQRFTDEDELASFLALFMVAYQFVTLLGVAFVSGRVLNRRGLRFGLTIVPLAGAALLGIALVATLVPGLAGLLFWAILIAKGVDWVLRNAFHFPSIRVLFAPLPAASRLRAQVSAEGLGVPLGIALASVILIVMTRLLDLPLTAVLLAALIMVILWLVMALITYPRYLAKLKDAIQVGRLPDVAHFVNNDEATLKLLRQNLAHDNPQVVLYTLNQLRKIDAAQIPLALIEILGHTDASMRRVALEQIVDGSYSITMDTIERLMADEDAGVRRLASQKAVRDSENLEPELLEHADIAIRQGALLGSLAHPTIEVRQASLAYLEELVGHQDVEARAMASVILGELARPDLASQLTRLLEDEDIGIRQKAIVAAGKTGGELLWPRVVDQLSDEETGRFALQALTTGGAATYFYLQDELSQTTLPWRELRRIATLCQNTRASQALPMLLKHQDTPNLYARLAVLNALIATGYQHEKGTTTAPLETNLEQAIKLILTRQQLAENKDLGNVVAAIESNLLLLRQELYAQIALFYSEELSSNVRRQLISGVGDQKSYAIELLSSTVPVALGPAIITFLDPPSQSGQLGKRFTQKTQTAQEQLFQLLEADNSYLTPWIQATIIHALALPAKSMATAQLIQRALDAIPHVAAELGLYEGRIEMFSQIEQIIALKTTPFFAQTDEAALARITGVLSERRLAAGEQLFEQGDDGDRMYIIVSGKIDIRQGAESLITYGPGEIVGEMAIIDSQPRSASAIGLEECELLILSQSDFQQIVEEYPEVARQIMRELSRRLRHTASELEKAKAA